jgi:hypothetical protein
MTCPVCGRSSAEDATECGCGFNFQSGRGGAKESNRKLAFRSGVALICVGAIVPAILAILLEFQPAQDRQASGLGVTFALTLFYCLTGLVVGAYLIARSRRS